MTKYSDDPKIKERLEAFETGERHFRGAGDAFNISIEEQRADNGHAQVNLRAIQRAEQAGLNHTEKPAADGSNAREREPNGDLAKWEKIVADGKAALKEKQKKQNELHAHAGNYSRARKLAIGYLLKLTPGTELLFANPKAIKRKQEADPEALIRIEAEIADAWELRKKTLRAPKSVDEAKACWTAQVRKLAKAGEPDWHGLHGAEGKEARLRTVFIDGIGRPDGVPLLAWGFEEVLIEKGHRAIDEFTALEGSDGLGADARAAKIADLDSVIAEKEADWESLWFSLAKSGVFVPRRNILTGSALPLLGLSEAMPKLRVSLN